MQMNRKDYKALKHMDRQQLTAYMMRIYRRGYEAGQKADVRPAAGQLPHLPDTEDSNQEVPDNA